MEIQVGLRVVRGPDWEWGDQDGGEGHVGTVVEVPEKSASFEGDHHEYVVVQWDYGKRFRYRCGVEGQYDLRVFDSAPSGIIHTGVLCDSCDREDVLSGMRWKCAYCFDYDLCSSCYMAKKHNLEHKFTRFDKRRALMHYVSSRSGARQIEAKGIFKGADVSRDLDWVYGDEDGRPGGVGKVLSCRQWHDEESYRSAVDVQWALTQKCTLCRVGHKGKVDVKCINSASGGFYYPDHLPILGAPYRAPGPREFASGDYVKVELDEEAFSAAMKSGNSLDTIMIIGEVGVIQSISDGRKVTVKFSEDRQKTVDISILVKAGIPRIWTNQVVRVIDDMAEVMKLQVGHGDWRDGMENIVGKTGIVLGQANKGDVAVRFEGRETDFMLNPHCLVLTNDESTLKPGVGFQRDDGALQAEVQALFEQDSSYVLFQAARLGDGTVIREFLNKFSNEVDKKFENGRTALHQAALQGYMSVVKVLLEFGADKDLSDNDGRTPLHFCALRSNTDVATVLLQDGANPNLTDLEGRTPLIIAASQGKTSTVQVFIDSQKTDLNIQDKDKNTALHHAVLASWHWSVRLLLLAKAEPAKMNSKDQAPLHIACGKGFTAGVEEILKHYPDQVNLKNGTDKTPLYFATLNGHADIVTYLLSQQDCDVNIKSLEGHTPLHAAMVCGVPKSVEKLIDRGANVNARDKQGDTPLHLLRMVRRKEEIKESDDLPELMKVTKMLKCYENVTSQTVLACFLVYKGADIYVESNSGTTALQELPIEVSAIVATFGEKNFKEDTQGCTSETCPCTSDMSSSASGEASNCPDNQMSMCMLCDEPVTVMLFPCGHAEICALCVKRATKCPLCKNRISEVKSINHQSQTD